MTFLTSAFQRDLLKWLSSYDQLCLSSSILHSFAWSNASGILVSLYHHFLFSLWWRFGGKHGRRQDYDGATYCHGHILCLAVKDTNKNCKIHIEINGYIERNSGSHPQIPTKREMTLDDFKEKCGRRGGTSEVYSKVL